MSAPLLDAQGPTGLSSSSEPIANGTDRPWAQRGTAQERAIGEEQSDPRERRRLDSWQSRLARLLCSTWALSAAGAAALCAIAFIAGGGLSLAPTVAVEMAVTIAGALTIAACLLIQASRDSKRRPVHGLWPAILLACFALLSGVSVAWSVEPDASWQEAGRVLAYAFLFAAAIALARTFPRRWSALLGAVTLASVIISGYALLTKIFPAQLAAQETYARLQAPYGYWIATGLTAAMGIIGCLWLGARRDGHALLRMLAYPAIGIELVTLMLTYSRGPMVALLIGLALWLALVPLRLRAVTLLSTGALCASGVIAFAFSSSALSNENVQLAARNSAGHQLGILVVAMLLALLFIGAAIGFISARRPPSRVLRRRVGFALLGSLLALILVAMGGLSLSRRGLTGSISHSLETLTNPNLSSPANTPGRFTAVANVRARYWKEALEIFAAHPLLGSGGEGYATARLRYRTDTPHVRHAHGFVVQTLADLGLLGLIVMLALLIAWMVAAGRTTHPFNRRWRHWRWRALSGTSGRDATYTPERIAMLSLLCIVFTFGVHSLVDWTWYVPGDACMALVCAGWLAGRGPLEAIAENGPLQARSLRPAQLRTPRLRMAVYMAFGVLIAALLSAYTQFQPMQAEQNSERALELAAAHSQAALASAQSAISEDPLSANARLTLAAVQEARGEAASARSTLASAVSKQPANPKTWQALGEYDLTAGAYALAVQELRAAVYLDPMAVAPESQLAGQTELLTLRNAYLSALRASGG